ncbi:hypothetical protein [Agrobacterium tumefaciens]|uniref:hypothetical protein n=1 Tax=Agrobacterium tumefaciens TaxID=358 RepID=UPI000975F117|nr:hypothetical protein BV900_28250 [Agrobacterium tumefaciens]
MDRSDAIFTYIFKRLKGSIKPKLAYPTAAAFDEAQWDMLDHVKELTDRDFSLLTGAYLIGPNLAHLRNKYFDTMFPGLSRDEIVAFAVADANRSWSILRVSNDQEEQRQAAQTEAIYSGTSGQLELNIGPDSLSGGTANTLNMAVVDSLPHWFAVASKAPEGCKSALSYQYSEKGQLAHYCFSLERALKEVWLQLLWEPWEVIDIEKDDWVVQPTKLQDRAIWTAWEWRDSNLMFQHALARKHFGETTYAQQPQRVFKTATGVSRSGAELKISIGEPSFEQSEGHRSVMVTLESSYLGNFADDPISPKFPDITIRLLELTNCVLHDLTVLLLPREEAVEYRSREDIQRIACCVHRSDLTALIAEALSISDVTAQMLLDRLVSRPFDDLSATFKNGLWHRPVVAASDDAHLYIVASSLMWGSPVRRFERWLAEANPNKKNDGEDLSKTQLGKKYERIARDRIGKALQNNALLSPISSIVTSIGDRQAAEEIDGLFRVGSSVFVLEIKCFLSPSEPIDRHNYLVKLEGACEQASRKVTWLRDNPHEVESRLGSLPADVRFVPLVVINQSTGASLRIDDTVIVDIHFLSMYLTSGIFRRVGAVDLTQPDRYNFSHGVLYETAEEAEANMPVIFENHPTLSGYLSSVTFDHTPIPLFQGGHIFLATPKMDEEHYRQLFPAHHEILPARPQ